MSESTKDLIAFAEATIPPVTIDKFVGKKGEHINMILERFQSLCPIDENIRINISLIEEKDKDGAAVVVEARLEDDSGCCKTANFSLSISTLLEMELKNSIRQLQMKRRTENSILPRKRYR
mmetsp:Transcript_10916/g.14194  ORF Transcript_10916/g.14194 Transcript_10916/m.14194 type:complete len:121 (-) Transcript_10916:306-668(-)